MKPLDVMDDDERIEFCLGALRIIDETRNFNAASKPLRLALIALWVMNRERPAANMKTHYEVDPSSFLDEAVSAGTIFFENLQVMMKDPPPGVPLDAVEYMVSETAKHIRTLRDPRYREYIVRAWEGFLEDLREYGE